MGEERKLREGERWERKRVRERERKLREANILSDPFPHIFPAPPNISPA